MAGESRDPIVLAHQSDHYFDKKPELGGRSGASRERTASTLEAGSGGTQRVVPVNSVETSAG